MTDPAMRDAAPGGAVTESVAGPAALADVERCVRWVLFHALLAMAIALSLAALLGYWLDGKEPHANFTAIGIACLIAHPAAGWGAERFVKVHGDAHRALAATVAAAVGIQLLYFCAFVGLCMLVARVAFG